MIQDPTDLPTQPDPVAEPGSAASDLPPATTPDVDTDVAAEDEEDGALPEAAEDDSGEPVLEGPLALGRAAIEHAVKHAPHSPGVYRMLNAANDVLYVGKAKNVKKRLSSYARPTGHVMRIARMIAATVVVEIISTATETEALLLEANLIKQLRPR
ncbi:MAG: Excinuclease subunit, partial [Tardiphaga sp.]|nr:Excinuclease subunit [Tardiphaga sp.]